MNIPNFIEAQVVDEDGKFTDVWRNLMIQLLKQMQVNLSDEGLVIPSQSTAHITTIQTGAPNGALLYDSSTDLAKVKIAGTFRTITTS